MSRYSHGKLSNKMLSGWKMSRQKHHKQGKIPSNLFTRILAGTRLFRYHLEDGEEPRIRSHAESNQISRSEAEGSLLKCLNRIFAKTAFTKKFTDELGRSFSTQNKVWSSKESLQLMNKSFELF